MDSGDIEYSGDGEGSENIEGSEDTEDLEDSEIATTLISINHVTLQMSVLKLIQVCNYLNETIQMS